MSTSTTPSQGVDGVQVGIPYVSQDDIPSARMELDSLPQLDENSQGDVGEDNKRVKVNYGIHLEKLKKQRDSMLLQLCLLNNDGDDDLSEREIKLTDMVEKLNHKIKVFEDAIPSSSKAAPGISKYAPKGDGFSAGIRLSRQDIPKFQLKSQNRYFPGSNEAYDTVEMFISQFEKVIASADLSVGECWKNIIPLSFPIELDAWLNADLLSCSTWTEACKLLIKKFGSSQAVFLAKRRVINMSMNGNETVNEYYIRFTRAASEAGYRKDDTTLADFYFNGFPDKWQTQINTVLVATHTGDGDMVGVRTIDEITTAANNVFGDRTYSGKRGHDEHSENNHSHSRFDKKRRQYQDIIKKSKKFFCSKHGGPNHSHDEKDRYSKKKEGTTFESPLNRVYIDNNTSFIKPIRLGNVNVLSHFHLSFST